MDKTSKQIGTLVMLVGIIVGGYGMRVVMSYFFKGTVAPLFFGQTPMPFSTSCALVIIGWMGLFWVGWNTRRLALIKPKRSRQATAAETTAEAASAMQWTPADIQKLVGMIIGLLSAALMVWGGMKK